MNCDGCASCSEAPANRPTEFAEHPAPPHWVGAILSEVAQDKTAKCERRPVGRPRTRTEQYFLELLKFEREARNWFAARHGRPPKSDRELLMAYSTTFLEAIGKRAGRLATEPFKRRMRSMCTELSRARTLVRVKKINPAFIQDPGALDTRAEVSKEIPHHA